VSETLHQMQDAVLCPLVCGARSLQHVQSLFSYIRPGYIHSGYNRDHGGTTELERSRNVKLKRTCHPVFVLDLTQKDLLELHGSVYNPCRLRSELR